MRVMLVAALIAGAAAVTPAPRFANGQPAAPDSAAGGAADSTAGGAPPAAGSPAPVALRLVDDGVVVASGSGRGAVVEPAGLALDAFGRLYVTDASRHRLQRFERDGRPSAESGALGSDPNQMRRPGAAAVLGSAGVAVLDVENRRVVSFDLFGRRIGVLVDLAAADLQAQLGRIDPVALAADRGGAVYVADREADRILEFDFAGRYLRTVGGFGSRPGSFRGLAGVAAAGRGALAAVDRGNARVQRIDAAGRAIAAWELPARPGNAALAIALDDSGRVAVADEAAGRLWLFAPGGAELAALTGLARPRAIAFAEGALLVAETAPGRVRRLRIEPATAAPPRED